jgi:hypothetical protein
MKKEAKMPENNDVLQKSLQSHIIAGDSYRPIPPKDVASVPSLSQKVVPPTGGTGARVLKIKTNNSDTEKKR